MTTIAAVVDPTTYECVMGGDTATTANGLTLADSVRKAQRIPFNALPVPRMDALFGVCGSGAAAQFALTGWSAPTDLTGPGLDLWANGIARRWEAWGRDNDMRRDDGGMLDASGLLAIYGRLWVVADGGAYNCPEGFRAMGSGGDIAQGALAQSAMPPFKMCEAPAVSRVLAAVGIAARYDPWTSEPVYAEKSAPREDAPDAEL